MARMLHRREPPASGQKVFIAIAAYQDLSAGFTWSLFQTARALEKAGIASELAIYSGNVHVDDSRNRLTRDFLLSDCTDMVFLDADLGWYAADFVKLLGFDRDVVAGIYPKKNGDDTYPVKLFAGRAQRTDEAGLLEVEGVPTGFLRIRRGVLERLAREATLYNAKNDGAYSTACIFERQIHAATRWGGDYVFCRKARAAGFKIYIDPTMRFEHSGEHVWAGQVGAWMRQRAGIGLLSGLEAISAGRETIDDLIDLYDVWGNPFAADPVVLGVLAACARASKGPIIECGAGLSSLVLAAANPNVAVHTLEDAPMFAEQVRLEAEKYGLANLTIHCRPHKGGWYDTVGLPDLSWALAFIDGPRRTLGGRADALNQLDLSRAIVVGDDVQAGEGEILANALDATHKVMRFEASAGASRQFAVSKPRAQTQKQTLGEAVGW